MSLETIISITGKPGLYQIVSQIKNGLIVESITEKKRMPVYASDKVSSLNDISIYTYSGDLPLKEVYDKMAKHTDGKVAPDHKSSPEELRSFLEAVIEDFDQERVYNSDLKKLFQWFNILVEHDLLKEEKKEEVKEEKEEKPKKKKAPAAEKKPAKKTAAKK